MELYKWDLYLWIVCGELVKLLECPGESPMRSEGGQVGELTTR